MNLPHAEPLIFAKEILSRSGDSVQVRCEFNTLPSLAMFVEAAAQSSAAFGSDGDAGAKNGFLTRIKDVKLLGDIKEKNYVLKIEMKIEINNIKQLYFEVYEDYNDRKCASGYLTLLIQE